MRRSIPSRNSRPLRFRAAFFYSYNPRLKDLRHRHVAGFRKYVIIYRPIDGGIEVVRVVSGRRNIAALFGTG
jgi:hypothetical protein